MIGAAILLIAAVAAVVVWLQRQSRQAAGGGVRASFVQLTDQPGPELLPTISPDGKFVAYEAAGSGNLDIYLQRVGGRNPLNLTADSPADDYQPVFSPDGQSIAFRSERDGGGIFVMGATGESVRRLSDFGHHPTWSPDGKKIAVATEGPRLYFARSMGSTLWTIDIGTAVRKKILESDGVQPAWSPHGWRIAFWSLSKGSGQRDIGTVSAEGGEVVWATSDASLDADPVWSPDGKHLYFSSDRGGSTNLWRLPIDERSGKPKAPPEPIATPSGYAMHASLAADGRSLVFASNESRANITRLDFDPVKMKVLGPPRLITKGSRPMTVPSVSRDGQWLAFASGAAPTDIFVARSDGTGEMRQLTSDPYQDRFPSWSPDGKRIIFYSDRSGSYEIWMMNPDGSDLRKVTRLPIRSWQPVFSPDGTQIAVASTQGSAIYEMGPLPLDEPKRLPPLGIPGANFHVSAWSPDGKRLVGGAVTESLQGTAIVIYSFETGRYDIAFELGPTLFSKAAWLPDGRHIAFSAGRKLFLGDLVSRQKREVYSDETADLLMVVVPPDGRAIYFQRATREADLWLATLSK